MKTRSLRYEDYEYKNLPIYGGGFVTGILFHPNAERLYIRTDIGGLYRYDLKNSVWEFLGAHITAIDNAETYPLAIAVDKDSPDSLFSVCGNREVSYLCISYDCGSSFIRRKVPCSVHGNHPGRGTGERLHIRNGRIYFGSMTAGILVSEDMGESWDIFTVNGEKNISCLWISEDESLVIAGCSGEDNSPDGEVRGHTLYYSTDGCKNFIPLDIPQYERHEEAAYQGFVPQRMAYNGEFLYVTFNFPEKVAYGGFGSYACDGGRACDGAVYRYRIENGIPVFSADITPYDEDAEKGRRAAGGFSGICCSEGMILTSTICRLKGDIIYRSYDNGKSWDRILYGTRKGRINWSVSYMKPEYNGGGSCLHWLSDLKISPFDKDLALFNTGTGIFMLRDLRGEDAYAEPLCNGIEETVHLNVYSPPSGKIRVIDIVGDLGGFAFEDIEKPCENSFADENGNRYITCLNADYTLKDPEYVVATPRGNWTGKTFGGIIVSSDCKNWKRLPDPTGISGEIDKAVEDIRRPNVDSGWAAVTADGRRIIWAMTRKFSSHMTVYTDDEGIHWHRSVFKDSNGEIISREMTVRVYSDLYDADCVYGITDELRLFVSFDKGEVFREYGTGLPHRRIMFNRFQAARQTGKPYTFWIADGSGLYVCSFDKEKAQSENKLFEGEYAFTAGFGKGRTEDMPSLYCTGVIGGEYGFFRSDDLGESFTKVNDPRHNYGDIIAVCGDGREHGRFYLATGTYGILTGCPRADGSIRDAR